MYAFIMCMYECLHHKSVGEPPCGAGVKPGPLEEQPELHHSSPLLLVLGKVLKQLS